MTNKKDLTGLETAPAKTEKEREAQEYNLVKNLLKAAEFKNSQEAITEVAIKRDGEILFYIHLKPLSETDLRGIRKKATTFMPNPANKKLPPIEKEVNDAKFNSLLIYQATTDADKKAIWGAKEIMEAYDLMEPWESVDILLLYGEKLKICDVIFDISGMADDEEITAEDYAKN